MLIWSANRNSVVVVVVLIQPPLRQVLSSQWLQFHQDGTHNFFRVLSIEQNRHFLFLLFYAHNTVFFLYVPHKNPLLMINDKFIITGVC